MHDWDLSLEEAKNLQIELSKKVLLQPYKSNPIFVAGADLAYSKKEALFFASLIVYTVPDFKVVRELFAYHKGYFPYIPGYLSFREAPILLELFEKLDLSPDLIYIDGQGIAHPRGLGLASHIGLFLNTPTIGIAKSRLVGKYIEPADKLGAYSSLKYKGKVVGYCLRTRSNTKPVFISPGHLVSLRDIVPLVIKVTSKYRIPIPTRYADIAVKRYKERQLGYAS